MGLVSQIHSYDLTALCLMSQALFCYQLLFSARESQITQMPLIGAGSATLDSFEALKATWIQLELNLYSWYLDGLQHASHF